MSDEQRPKTELGIGGQIRGAYRDENGVLVITEARLSHISVNRVGSLAAPPSIGMSNEQRPKTEREQREAPTE